MALSITSSLTDDGSSIHSSDTQVCDNKTSSSRNKFEMIRVGGETIEVPISLLTHLQTLPWLHYSGGVFSLDADPKSFRWILWFLKKQCLPVSFFLDKPQVDSLFRLTVLLGLHDLTKYMEEHCIHHKQRVRTAAPSTKKFKKKASKLARANSDKLRRLSASAWSNVLMANRTHTGYNKTPCHELVMGSSPAVV